MCEKELWVMGEVRWKEIIDLCLLPLLQVVQNPFLSPFSHFDVKVLEILKIHSNFHNFFEEPIFLNL
jgi:hypothetical protein